MRTFSTGSHRPLEDHNSNRGADGTEVFAAPCFRLRPWTMGPEPASVGPNAPGSAGIIQRRREIRTVRRPGTRRSAGYSGR